MLAAAVAALFVVSMALPAYANGNGMEEFESEETFNILNPCTEAVTLTTFVVEGRRRSVFDGAQGFHWTQRGLWFISTADGFESIAGGVGFSLASPDSLVFVGSEHNAAVVSNPETGQRFSIFVNNLQVSDATGEWHSVYVTTSECLGN